MNKSFQLKISGKKSLVTLIEDPAILNKKSVPDVPIHHILLIDGSGSMYGVSRESAKAVEVIASTIVRPQDFLTVVKFHGTGDYKLLVSWTKTSEPSLKNALRNLSEVHGTTCFSDPFAELIHTSEQRFNCDRTLITILTDGCAVVPWSSDSETEKVCNSIKKIAENTSLIGVNSIGYGNWYNEKFLREITEVVGQGNFTHSSKIEDFSQMYDQIFNYSRNLTDTKIDLIGNLCIHESAGVILSKEGNLTTKVSATDNRLILVDFESSEKPTDTQSSLYDPLQYLYIIAYALYNSGKRRQALDLMSASVKDKFICNKMINAFTRDEVAEVLDSIKKAISNESMRFIEGKTSPSFLPKRDAYCLLDFLKDCSRLDVKYIPFHEKSTPYNRITRETIDEGARFVKSDAEVQGSCKNLVWNSKRLNLSLKFSIDGTVKLNHRAAVAANLPEEQPCKIFRNHTFVMDGVPNVKSAVFKSTSDEFKATVLPKVSHKALGDDYFLIDMNKKLPVVNQTYLYDEIAPIYEKVVKLTSSKAIAKIVREKVSELTEAYPSLRKSEGFAKLKVDQIKVLEEHGIDSSFNYRGDHPSVDKVEDSDFYEAREIDFYLKGFSSFPKTSEVLEKVAGNKKLTPSVEMISRTITAIDKLTTPCLNYRQTFELLESTLEATENDISSLMNDLSACKLATVLYNSWWSGLTTSDKGEESYSPTEADTPMILKSSRTKVYY